VGPASARISRILRVMNALAQGHGPVPFQLSVSYFGVLLGYLQKWSWSPIQLNYLNYEVLSEIHMKKKKAFQGK